MQPPLPRKFSPAFSPLGKTLQLLETLLGDLSGELFMKHSNP